MNRRSFLKTSAAAVAGTLCASGLRAQEGLQALPAKADSCIFIWLPGGVAQTDTFDPKEHTPFKAGMKGSELLGTCPSIATAIEGVKFGAGLEKLGAALKHGSLVRSVTSSTKFGGSHVRAQYFMMTGYLFPSGVKAPSIGAIVSRSLGRRNKDVPPYIYIGRDIGGSDDIDLFVNEYIGPGFYGPRHAPFMIPDPSQGLETLNAQAGMTAERLDKRLEQLQKIAALQGVSRAPEAQEFLTQMAAARAMMDSPVKAAFNYMKEEKPETIAAYEPPLAPNEIFDGYNNSKRFGHGLLLARRLVERGARFVQVEYKYGAVKGFDTHDNGAGRIAAMKKQIDGPIAQLIADLKERGLLERTLVVVATEFGRTIAAVNSNEPAGFGETNTGEDLIIKDLKTYGFHGHFSSASCMMLFGGGVKQGFVYGKTANKHPLTIVEQPAQVMDLHATIYSLLGISPETYFLTENRPFFVTRDGKGEAIRALMG